MLENAGVDASVTPASVDESIEKRKYAEAGDLATALAQRKALAVSMSTPDAWVIGSDSVVSVGDRLFDKPASRAQAADHLRFFSGKTMTLTSAVALARAGIVEWHHSDSASLVVRPLSDSFIGSYLDAEWPEVGYCVGVFRLEGRGVQLFESIDGSFFTVLGMPLLPLLGALRERGIIES